MGEDKYRMNKTHDSIQQKLISLADKEYKAFQEKLMPTVPGDKVLGVRVPLLRKLAKEIYSEKAKDKFLNSLPHKYYEEDNLHAFLIELIPDFEECKAALNTFLPFVDNWATCDSMNPKIFKKRPCGLLEFAYSLIERYDVYSVRYGIGILMKYYLDDGFSPEFPVRVAEIKSGEYYIKMMQAWYFQLALAKQYDRVIGFIESKRLDKWVHNKAIQKCLERRVISKEKKKYLKTLKYN